MKNKSLTITFITTSFILASLFFGVLFTYDPLQLFHSPWQYKKSLHMNMRQQAAGILNNWDYDSIILGTSVLETTSSKEASKQLDGKFINVSIAGSDFFERAIVLNYVLKKQKIKKVLFSLDSASLENLRRGDKSYNIKNWDYLYDDNPLNDFKAYIKYVYLKCLFLTFNKKKCMGRQVDLDRPNTWHEIEVHSERFGGLDNWFKTKYSYQKKLIFKPILDALEGIKNNETESDKNIERNILKSHKYIDETLIKFISKYKNTEFILVLPPYSRIRYAINAQYYVSLFEKYKQSTIYLVNKSKEYPNLKIYGWGNHSFVDDIANYRDLDHYEHTINSWMLGAIKRKEGLLTTENIDNYLKIFTQKALNYNLFEIGNKINNSSNKP